jgi:5'-3' exonuclease
MGIPSYYKKLSDRIKGLIIKSKPVSLKGLYVDFNCMIYHCARRPNSKLPPYPGDDGKVEWENLLIDDIVRYIVKIWHEVGQPKEVLLAVDGVVPLAKIKQQRLRRFKSIWLAAEEGRNSATSWDTNCITPGTDFMRRLGSKLEDLCAKRAGWRISGADEPGEGEHKIMNVLRKQTPSDSESVAIYGLDGDLILLTLMNARMPSFLMREDSEMGVVQTNSLGEETFSYFSLDVLKKAIWTSEEPTEEVICEYVAAMSLLGNDFIPHSLTVKIKDNGHELLVNDLAKMRSEDIHLVTNIEGQWKMNSAALLWLFTRWSAIEEDRMLNTIKKKLKMRGQCDGTLETKPLEWAVEQTLVTVNAGDWKIKPVWREHYTNEWLFCPDATDLTKCCAEYVSGLQWVLDYYTGQSPVNMLWCYPRLVPPLWSQLANYLKTSPLIVQVSSSEQKPILPHEQLAMVLPLESWHLLENKALRSLPGKYPHYWPTRFDFFSAGRIRMWECEPLIPLLPLERLR